MEKESKEGKPELEKSDVSNSQYVGTWKGEKLTAAGQEVTEGKWTDTDKGPKVYADNNKGAVYKVDGDTMEMDAVVAKVYLKKH